jgi:hypothetical protein
MNNIILNVLTYGDAHVRVYAGGDDEQYHLSLGMTKDGATVNDRMNG